MVNQHHLCHIMPSPYNRICRSIITDMMNHCHISHKHRGKFLRNYKKLSSECKPCTSKDDSHKYEMGLHFTGKKKIRFMRLYNRVAAEVSTKLKERKYKDKVQHSRRTPT